MVRDHQLGKLGEQLAVKYLKEAGYTIKARNFRFLKAEIDIIAQKDGVLAIVEVKTRNSGFYEDLSSSVSVKKRSLLVMAANHYVLERQLDLEVCFDIITVVISPEEHRIEHLVNAFYHF